MQDSLQNRIILLNLHAHGYRRSPPPEQLLAKLVRERHAIAPRLDLLEIEPLEMSGSPSLSDPLDDIRADRL